ncbi:solute carrier family 2, facilitated glucose transporter member 12 [Parasteatoda tepidariorum]|uniref:solute carrier family 2, facilitated glucose transporter member 12 n=1 Tax=Parasteatoda tepidariorum TaxID=114398 RepID=UPI001C718F27|nr:solute carrier family 2, facilitated glucose transporter member 10 [Parasteatoda tepidariorum]
MPDQQSAVEKNNSLVVFSAVIASIGGILFGYDIGIISGALLQLKETFTLSYFEQELVVCGVLIGAFCASFFGGNVVDSFGRKAGIIISCGFFITGSVILFLSINFIMLIIGRVIVGIAISLSVTAECTYISEISPPSCRGMMVSFNEVGITTGFLIAYLMNYIFISMKNGWKWMFGVAILPAILQGIGVAFMPSSHHYLIAKGQIQKAREVLIHLRKSENVEEEMEAILKSMSEQKSFTYKDLFRSAFNMRSRMFLGMTLVFLQQFSGNANVLYYAPTVFQHFGYSTDTSATLVSVGLGIVKVIATIITLLMVDRVGRRSLLLTGSVLMALSIILLGIVGTLQHSSKTDFSTRIISVISLMVFVCAYSISYGPVTWLVLSEIFPGSVRGRAVSVATCINWASNIIVSLTFLDVLNAMGIGPVFVTYEIICFAAAIFIFFCVPETKNKSLEEINQVLTKGLLKKGCRKYSCERNTVAVEQL